MIIFVGRQNGARKVFSLICRIGDNEGKFSTFIFARCRQLGTDKSANCDIIFPTKIMEINSESDSISQR